MKCLVWMVVLLGLLGGSAFGEKKADPVDLSVTLATKDGSSLVGAPLSKGVRMKSAFGDLALPYELLAGVCLGPAEGQMTVEFKNQDRLSGTCLDEWIGVDTAFGVQKVAVGFIREIRIRSTVPRDGLLAYYPFDGDGGDVVRDASGNERDGKVVGAVYTPEGWKGGAYRVGRGCGYIEIPHNPAWDFGDKPFSISLWLKLDGPPYGDQMLMGHDEGGGPQNKWTFQFWNQQLCFHVNTPQGNGPRIAVAPWRGRVGRWHHLAVTRNGPDFRTYVDGACVAQEKLGRSVPNATAPLTIGQSEMLYVEGMLDDVMIFDRALSEEEIRGMGEGGN